MRYIALVSDDLHLEAFRVKIREQAPEAEQAAMTIAEQMRREGREEGLERGLEQGREEGHHEGRVAMLTKLLTLKFGDLSQAHRPTSRSLPRPRPSSWSATSSES